ncbi:50S ribosomal protein L29 [Candidatus Gottesmanbacteria bacterium]|nr:50S ribosomal protein L29 [Candidatus Gottesmanbacteria bacterium]
MKIQEFKNLRQKEDKELLTSLASLKKEITKLGLEMAMKKVKNVSLLGQKKKDIARILTILRERKTING